MKFEEFVNTITKQGLDWHRERILANTEANRFHVKRTIRQIEPDAKPALIVSAGPSLARQKILERVYDKFSGNIIATESAYIRCLKAGIVPDYVVTLDPHPTRIVRWLGDPDMEANAAGDDYFERQDLDVEFRENAIKANAQNIELVNQWADKSRFIVATTAPANVVKRLQAAVVNPYWFVPLVDSPAKPEGLTRQMCAAANAPAMNTGGTCGTAAWVFAHTRLKASTIGVVGMDYSYYMDTPFQQTQSWNMLKGMSPLHEFYPHYTGPWGEAYTDPTYWWYRANFLDLLAANKARIVNASEAGLLFGPGVLCTNLDQWLAYSA